MKYGRLFTKFRTKYPDYGHFTSNKCSELTYKELRNMAHLMYSDHKDVLRNYFMKNKEDLSKMVYKALIDLKV